MKTRSWVALLLTAGALLFAAACSDSDRIFDPASGIVHGDGNVVEESRPIGAFSRLDHGGVGIVYIDQGAQEQLRIRAEENLIEHLYAEVQGGELVTWKDNSTLMNTRPMEYHLTVVDLDRVALTGAGGIRGSNLATGPLEVLLTGVGTIEILDLNAPLLEIESSGMGETLLSGSVQEQTVRSMGMAPYDGSDLTSAVADVLIADGGSATVRVQDHLTVTINGSGSVYYIGDPVIDKTIYGSGVVVKIGG